MARIQRNAPKSAQKTNSRASTKTPKTPKVAAQAAKAADPSRTVKARKPVPSPGDAEARAAVASVYARLDAWNSGSIVSDVRSTPARSTGVDLGRAELAALANTEALWLVR